MMSGTALRKAGATQAECLAVSTDTIFWRDRESDGKAENPDQLMEKIYGEDLDEDDERRSGQQSILQLDDPSKWAGLPVPRVEWIWEEWIPLEVVTLLYGDGGTGKTLLAQMLAVLSGFKSHGTNWLT